MPADDGRRVCTQERVEGFLDASERQLTLAASEFSNRVEKQERFVRRPSLASSVRPKALDTPQEIFIVVGHLY